MLEIEPTNAQKNKQHKPKNQPTDRMTKPVLKAHTGIKEPRQIIGRIYLPAEWIGKIVICSTVWKEGDTITGQTNRTNPEIIRDEYEPGRLIAVIYRRVCKHNAGNATAGRISLPREWIGKDVLIRLTAEAEAITKAPKPHGNGEPATIPQGA